MLLVLRDCEMFGFWPGEYGGGGEGIDAGTVSITYFQAWDMLKEAREGTEDAQWHVMLGTKLVPCSGQERKWVYEIYYIERECRNKGKEIEDTFHARDILKPRGARYLGVLQMLATDIGGPRPLLRIVGCCWT